MTDITDSERRKNDVLGAIIDLHVATAEPVGSEAICRRLGQHVSSATIRNVMAKLEEEGLLVQPHTSAGRVPTNRGYRYYVDSLMQQMRMSAEEGQRIAQALSPAEGQLDVLLERVSALLSQLSQQTAFVIAPSLRSSAIKHVELVPLSPRRLLCVLMGQEPCVASHIIDIEEPISRDEAVALANFFNAELTGLPADELLSVLERRLLDASDSFYHMIKRSLAILQEALATEPEARLYIEGARHLFEQPEFRKDPHKAHELLRQLELRQALMERVRADLQQPRWCVRIGDEVDIDGMEECSYILAAFGVPDAVLGGIGVLGPRRMDYRRMVALVDGMVHLVSDALAQRGHGSR